MNVQKIITCLTALLLLSSCMTDQKKLEPTVTTPKSSVIDFKLQEDLKKIWTSYFADDFSETRAVEVLYLTNRNQKSPEQNCDDQSFGNNLDASLKYGICKVNVPRNHVTGELKFTKDARQSSHDFFKNLSHKTTQEADLLDIIKKSQRIPLVFIHGFNVKFHEAILRAAQIAYDLKYQGPIVLLSWPAGAGDGFLDEKLVNVTYKNNKKSAEDSVQMTKAFFKSLQAAQLKANIVVHSMGHQVVLPALNELSLDKTEVENKKFINELVLNAPDFESKRFADVAENIKNIVNRITLYCSYNDNAMVASEVFNKNTRLGACANVDGIDSINVSLIDAPAMGVGGLGHGYYSSRPILSDLFQVLIGLDADKRLFIRKSDPNSTEKYYIRP